MLWYGAKLTDTKLLESFDQELFFLCRPLPMMSKSSRDRLYHQTSLDRSKVSISSLKESNTLGFAWSKTQGTLTPGSESHRNGLHSLLSETLSGHWIWVAFVWPSSASPVRDWRAPETLSESWLSLVNLNFWSWTSVGFLTPLTSVSPQNLTAACSLGTTGFRTECFQNLMYWCAGAANLTDCYTAYNTVFSPTRFATVANVCPAWKKGPLSADCNATISSFPTLETRTIAEKLVRKLFSNPRFAPCYPGLQQVYNWGTIASQIPAAPSTSTIVSGTAGAYMVRFLDRALAPARVNRAILNSLESSDTTTRSYLDTCNIGTASTDTNFLSGDYYETVYAKSIYQPLVPCLPWKRGVRSLECPMGLNQICSAHGPKFADGTIDQASGICGFATFSQKTVFTTPSYCPQILTAIQFIFSTFFRAKWSKVNIFFYFNKTCSALFERIHSNSKQEILSFQLLWEFWGHFFTQKFRRPFWFLAFPTPPR